MSDPFSAATDAAHTPGMPPGLTAEGAEMRSRIAASLTRRAFPSTGSGLVEEAESQQADPEVVQMLRLLPSGDTFESLTEVSLALGLGHEERPGGAVGR
jgi:hypothetical protein